MNLQKQFEAEDKISYGIRKYVFSGGCWEDLIAIVEEEWEEWQNEKEAYE